MRHLLALTLITVQFCGAQTANPRGAKAAPSASRTGPGSRYALMIGINQYATLPSLKTALADTRDVGAEMAADFGFKTEVLPDPGRAAILQALNRYRRMLAPEDSLLIYYAGHGHFDAKASKAYWLPADAQADDTTDWISADDITTNIKLIEAKHILVVSDSCYSGTIARAAPINLSIGRTADRNQYLANLEQRKSRLLLASGGNEPVSDQGGDGRHSIFATVLLQSLREMNRDRFTIEELFSGYIRERVAGRSSQVPECNPLRDSGHDGGSFLFERRSAAGTAPADIRPPTVTSGQRQIGAGEGAPLINLDPVRINAAKLTFYRYVPGVADVQFNPGDATPPIRWRIGTRIALAQQLSDAFNIVPDIALMIEGYAAENEGTTEFCSALGERRALAVKNILVSLGVPHNRLKTISRGKEYPRMPGLLCRPDSNPDCWGPNRCVHLVAFP